MAASLTVISDTSPLRYLIAIDRTELLESIFSHVLIPRGVERELTHPSAPESVREWIRQMPPWLEVRDLESPPRPELARRLDPGEAEAIQLAIDVRATFLLIDERCGRQMAAGRGVTVIGALAIVLESYRRNYVDDPLQLLEELRAARFRVSRRLVRGFEEEVRLIKAGR